MLVIKVELHSAITGRVSEIARSVIHNIGGNRDYGDYGAFSCRGRDAEELQKSMLAILQLRQKPVHQGKVKHHARLKLHVWTLVTKALIAMGYGDG